MMVYLRAALDMLPRYRIGRRGNDDWVVDGDLVIVNAQRLPDAIQGYITKIMDQVEALEYVGPKYIPIEWVDVSGSNVWVLHRGLKMRHLTWLCGRNWTWQRWKRSRLPIYLRFNGKLVVWNGTHRWALARLSGRKVRAKVLDINKFAEWRRGNSK